jgi:hypothetical protein
VGKAREAYAQSSHGPGRTPAWQAREEAAAAALAEVEVMREADGAYRIPELRSRGVSARWR